MKQAYRLLAGFLSAVMLGMPGASLYEEKIQARQVSLPMETAAVEMVLPRAVSSFSPIETGRTEDTVIPGGMPFGIKMFTDGVMVIGVTEIVSDGHTVSPAKAAGIRPGDVITRINGERVASNEDVARIVAGCAGEVLELSVEREETVQELSLRPVKCDESLGYRAGMWVRDSSAGIGTMTWLDPESGVFAGLGHAVCDIDTGNLMPLYSGEAVNVTITGVTKGESGRPGELRGAFSDGAPIGILTHNDVTGIYGRLNGTQPGLTKGEQLPIAKREEIRTGKACIRATVDGGGVKEYEIVIERIDLSEDHPTRNMVIRITDKRLIAVTGGIVQGMSGSPIIQDGKLVGAVTHVLVNDPTRGYGIFIENMLEAAK